ncbi:hypothetical protein KP509_1Z008600 [Ceratopteris richardii]|nr:hypothetical protein KP509_1Z008600 [Ceratopteris richardii]
MAYLRLQFCSHLVVLLSCFLLTVFAKNQPRRTSKPIQNVRAFNIAHRGANGELPEETAPAYRRAIEEGADFIETDILATKDGVLICFHDVTLNETTNVADYPEFSDRISTYEVQGSNITGWFSVDFTWGELKKLRTRQRYNFRDAAHNGIFPIIRSNGRMEGSMRMCLLIHCSSMDTVENISLRNGMQDPFLYSHLPQHHLFIFQSSLIHQKSSLLMMLMFLLKIQISHIGRSPLTVIFNILRSLWLE